MFCCLSVVMSPLIFLRPLPRQAGAVCSFAKCHEQTDPALRGTSEAGDRAAEGDDLEECFQSSPTGVPTPKARGVTGGQRGKVDRPEGGVPFRGGTLTDDRLARRVRRRDGAS